MADGCADGADVSAMEGIGDGLSVGELLGFVDGDSVGWAEGKPDDAIDGGLDFISVGEFVGDPRIIGEFEGDLVGGPLIDGDLVGGRTMRLCGEVVGVDGDLDSVGMSDPLLLFVDLPALSPLFALLELVIVG